MKFMVIELKCNFSMFSCFGAGMRQSDCLGLTKDAVFDGPVGHRERKSRVSKGRR